MIKTLLFLATCFIGGSLVAQKHVNWVFSAVKTAGGVYEVHCRAVLDKGWHIYSQSSPAKGPVPTKLVFSNNPLITLVGDAKEMGELEEHYEEVFKTVIKRYANSVDFVQTVKSRPGIKCRILAK